MIADSHRPEWVGPEGFEFTEQRRSFRKLGAVEQEGNYPSFDVPGCARSPKFAECRAPTKSGRRGKAAWYVRAAQTILGPPQPRTLSVGQSMPGVGSAVA